MNRRTVLKGATAGVAVGALGMRRPMKSSAARLTSDIQQELPTYEIVSFNVNDQFVAGIDRNWIGGVRDIANDGSIIGEMVVDSRIAPTIWDASLVPTVLDMGALAGMNGYGHRLNSAGRAIGMPIGASEFQTEAEAFASQSADEPEWAWLIWENGVLDAESSAAFSKDSYITTLTETGMMFGVAGTLPASWIDGSWVSIPLPAGYVSGGFRSYNANGDIAGTFYPTNDPYTGAVPFIMNAAGEFEIFDPPAGFPADWAGFLYVYQLGDDGSFTVMIRDEGALFGQAYRYANGMQSPVADLTGEGMLFRDVNARGVLIGQALMNGVSIPTIWIDDQPIAIADLIVPGPDLLFLEAEAINDSGMIVGSAQDSAGTRHHVLLRPM